MNAAEYSARVAAPVDALETLPPTGEAPASLVQRESRRGLPTSEYTQRFEHNENDDISNRIALLAEATAPPAASVIRRRHLAVRIQDAEDRLRIAQETAAFHTVDDAVDAANREAATVHRLALAANANTAIVERILAIREETRREYARAERLARRARRVELRRAAAAGVDLTAVADDVDFALGGYGGSGAVDVSSCDGDSTTSNSDSGGGRRVRRRVRAAGPPGGIPGAVAGDGMVAEWAGNGQTEQFDAQLDQPPSAADAIPSVGIGAGGVNGGDATGADDDELRPLPPPGVPPQLPHVDLVGLRALIYSSAAAWAQPVPRGRQRAHAVEAAAAAADNSASGEAPTHIPAPHAADLDISAITDAARPLRRVLAQRLAKPRAPQPLIVGVPPRASDVSLDAVSVLAVGASPPPLSVRDSAAQLQTNSMDASASALGSASPHLGTTPTPVTLSARSPPAASESANRWMDKLGGHSGSDDGQKV